MKKTLFLINTLLAASCVYAESLLCSWDFSKGGRIDNETGMTEFDRQGAQKFTGLAAVNSAVCVLKPDSRCNPDTLFVKGMSGPVLQIGLADQYVNAATAQLPQKLSSKEGSICFWMAPGNWNGLQRDKIRIFVAGDDTKVPRKSELLIYKNTATNNLVFLLGPNNPKKWSIVQTSIWKWKPNDWHFVCATWTKKDQTLYIDGKSVTAVRKAFPCGDFPNLTLGTRHWKQEGGLTLINYLNVYSKALTQAECDAVFRAGQRKMNIRSAVASFHLGESTPAASNGWGISSNITFDIHTYTMNNNIRWSLARDQKCLYVRCISPSPARKPSVSVRDGALWTDESVEFHLEHGKTHWQFIFNETNAFYDSRNGVPKWNADGVAITQKNDGKQWTVTAAIPWKNFDGVPGDGDVYFLTIARSGTQLSASSPLIRSFSDSANYLKIIMEKGVSPLTLDMEATPSIGGHFALTASGSGTLSMQANAMSAVKRKLYSQTVNGQDRVRLESRKLDADGYFGYLIKKDSKTVAEALLRYQPMTPMKVLYLKTNLDKQILECAVEFRMPVSGKLELLQELRDNAGKPAQEQRSSFQKVLPGQKVLEWNMKTLAPGRYDYSLFRLADGKKELLHHQFYFKPSDKEPWNTTTLPEIKTPLPPWKVPVVQENALSCLTQTYKFDRSLFPSEITVKGKQLLDSPIRLRLNGKVITADASFKILKKTDTEIHFQTEMTAENIRFTVNGILEFDGWCRFTMDYAPVDPAKTVIRDLALLIPISGKHSNLVSLFEPLDVVRKYMSGKLGNEFIADIYSHPAFWVGDADIGLFWGADSFRGTHLKNMERSLEMRRPQAGAPVTAAVRWVDTPMTLNAKRSISFGIQATPAKDQRNDMRRPFMLQGGKQNLDGFMTIFNYHNPAYCNKQLFQARYRAAQQRNEPFCGIYACIYGVSPFCPEWPWYCEQWISCPPGVGRFKQDFPVNSEKARNAGLWGFGCVNDGEFMRWQLHWLILSLKEMGGRDYYFDMAYPRACNNPRHGCGWTDDFGRSCMTYPIQANREFTKLIRKAMLDNSKDSVLGYHTSSETLPPVCCLTDCVYEGECLVTQVAKEESYYKIFTPEKFQACYSGVMCGTNNVYLAQFCRSCMMLRPEREAYWRQKVKAPEAVRAVRHYFGYCLLHNVRPMAGAGIANEGQILNRQLADVGFGDAKVRFIPYWHPQELPCKAKGNVLLSVYVLPDGKKLSVMLNDTDQTVVSGVIPAAKAKDFETGKDIELSKLSFSPRELKLIIMD